MRDYPYPLVATPERDLALRWVSLLVNQGVVVLLQERTPSLRNASTPWYVLRTNPAGLERARRVILDLP